MTETFQEISYRRHEGEFDSRRQGGAEEALARTWLKTDTVDYWRHARMYACLDPLLQNMKGASWVTVGDGRYGRDAWYLSQHGARAVATDISDVLLKEGKASGLIEAFSKENAEKLSFKDDSFDFAFCKESYHHFPRPMLALYEMLRVVKQGVVLIEPNESPVLGSLPFMLKRLLKLLMLKVGMHHRLRSTDTSLFLPYSDTYEVAGNYVYSISEREIAKVALGMNLPVVAFKGINDWYIKGVEQESASEKSVLFTEIKAKIRKEDRRSQRGLSLGAPILVAICIFKQTPTMEVRKALINDGYRVIDLPRNPHV
jgi:ubiquinone/menaquinone biosynthesis C-methylase UbiE